MDYQNHNKVVMETKSTDLVDIYIDEMDDGEIKSPRMHSFEYETFDDFGNETKIHHLQVDDKFSKPRTKVFVEPSTISSENVKEKRYRMLSIILFLLVIALTLALIFSLALNLKKGTNAIDPCKPNPCGANTISSVRGPTCQCQCLTGYSGNPLHGCKPECQIDSDCNSDETCKNLKCINPCKYICGVGVPCSVTNHTTQCIHEKNVNQNCTTEWQVKVVLVGGNNSKEGNVFALHPKSESYGPVCDTNWNRNNAKVVCRQLGFTDARNFTVGSFFGIVPNISALSQVECFGTEHQLSECRLDDSGNCKQNGGAGVFCF